MLGYCGHKQHKYSLIDVNIRPGLSKNQEYSLIKKESTFTSTAFSGIQTPSFTTTCIGNSMFCSDIWHKYNE